MARRAGHSRKGDEQPRAESTTEKPQAGEQGTPAVVPSASPSGSTSAAGVSTGKMGTGAEPETAPEGPKLYTVVARRYRPQQFAELIGQEHVAQALVQALQSGRVAHAYLFTGARGVGKTSTARILAKALNCVRGPTPYPCDACDICRAIATGEDVDVLEIDGASNRGIEDARDLRHSVGFRPVRARFKVYIIDEVHMLTREAFNALLKTLEEPPPHVKFIFATTEVQKIPITILSRCQRFDFAHVRPVQISEHLQRIVALEGREAEPEALRLIARKAAGSMRDAQSLLDQLLAAESGRLTLERVRQVLGLSSEEQVQQLAEAIFRRDAAAALRLLGQWYDQGMQPGELIEQLTNYWRNLMLIKCGGPDIRELPVDPLLREALIRQAEQTSLDTILAGLDVWTAVRARLRDAYQSQVLLEMAVVRLARMDELLSVGALWHQLVQGGNAPAASVISSPAGSGAAASGNVGSASPPPSAGRSINVSKADGQVAAPFAVIPLSAATIGQIWTECLRRLTERFPLQSKHLTYALTPVLSGANALVIRFPTSYNWAYEACVKAEEFTHRLEEVLKAITRQAVTVQYELSTAAVEGTTDKGGPKSATSEGDTASSQTRSAPADPRRLWLERPFFRKAADTLGAQIVRVDEGFHPETSPPNPTPPAENDHDDTPPPADELQ